MHPVRSLDLDRLPELREALAAWLEKARQEFRLAEVILYGSFARGEPHEGSDIDLILIGPFHGKLPHRIERIILTTDLPIQPLCYTQEEWSSMIAGRNPLALEVARSGRVL